ncbi:transposase, partial [Burkholderia gladioli]
MNKKSSKFSPEVRERAVRLVREQRSEHPSLWAAVESIAPMIGCTPQTLNDWVKRDEIDNGERDGLTTNERERLKALERENKELRKTNEILKLARVGSMDGCNTFLLISNEGGLTNGTNGKAGVVA